MSDNIVTIVCCFKGRKVYIPRSTTSVAAKEQAVEAFKDVGLPDVPSPENANLYTLIGHRKVYFTKCKADCGTKCGCGWTTVKNSDMVHLEDKLEMKRWYIRLPRRVRNIFKMLGECMAGLSCISQAQKPEENGPVGGVNQPPQEEGTHASK